MKVSEKNKVDIRGVSGRNLNLYQRAYFTIVELLVVIVIISILASLLLPALQKVKSKGYMASCINNERQIGLAMMMYTADNRGRISQDTNDDSNAAIGTAYSWDWVLLSYVSDNKKVFYCPADAFTRTSPVAAGRIPQSYFINHHSPLRGMEDPNSPTRKKIAKLKNPSQLFLIGCLNNFYKNVPNYTGVGIYFGANNTVAIGYHSIHFGPFGSQSRIYWDEHSNGSTMLFVDGHSKAIKESDLLGRWNLPTGDKPSRKNWQINY